MKPSLRPLLLLLALVLCFSLGMASLLNYFKFESTVKKLQRDRISLIADEVQKAVERTNSLGVELASSTTLQPLIERQLKVDSLVMLIDIFDEHGKILFSTDKTRIDSTAPGAWRSAAHRMQFQEWFLTEKNAFITGVVLKNSFDLVIGNVAVRYSRDGFDHVASIMGLYIGKVGLIAALAAFTVCGLIFGLFCFMIRRDVAKAEQIFNEDNVSQEKKTLIQHEVHAFKESADAAKRDLSNIEQSLLQLLGK